MAPSDWRLLPTSCARERRRLHVGPSKMAGLWQLQRSGTPLLLLDEPIGKAECPNREHVDSGGDGLHRLTRLLPGIHLLSAAHCCPRNHPVPHFRKHRFNGVERV